MLITDHFNLNVQDVISINFNFFATPHNPDDAQPGGGGGGNNILFLVRIHSMPA